MNSCYISCAKTLEITSSWIYDTALLSPTRDSLVPFIFHMYLMSLFMLVQSEHKTPVGHTAAFYTHLAYK